MRVGYAYPGFIYLPLFLAEERGYLSNTTELLDCAAGDKAALEQLLDHNHDDPADVVLCDPLVAGADLLRQVWTNIGVHEQPVVVASVIRNTPVWVYARNIKRPDSESALSQQLTAIKCYPSPNTGYFIASRLRDQSPNEPALVPIPFGKDDFDLTDPTHALVTSNVLQIAKYSSTPTTSGNVIFSYPTQNTSIKGMFFTGVLTKKSYLQTNLLDVLQFLVALKRAIRSIVGGGDLHALADEVFNLPSSRLDVRSELGCDENDVKKYIRIAVETHLRGENIYSNDLSVDEQAWEKNATLRRTHSSSAPPSAADMVNPFPALLVQDLWPETLWCQKAWGLWDELKGKPGQPSGPTAAGAPATGCVVNPLPNLLNPTPGPQPISAVLPRTIRIWFASVASWFGDFWRFVSLFSLFVAIATSWYWFRTFGQQCPGALCDKLLLLMLGLLAIAQIFYVVWSVLGVIGLQEKWMGGQNRYIFSRLTFFLTLLWTIITFVL